MKNALFSLCATVALVSTVCASDGWMTDLPAALAQSAKENKPVMVDFNGSDWCGPCMMLKSKVFDTPEFAAYAKDKLILVDIDMPSGDKLTPEQKAVNKALVEKYAIDGYPTVVVFNKDGAVLGGHSGGTDQIARVTANLDAALANAAAINAAMAKGAAATGVAKAQAYMEAYELTPAEFKMYNTTVKELVMANDPDDTCGLAAAEKAKMEKAKAQDEAYKLVKDVPSSQQVAVIKKELQKPDLSPAYKSVLERNLIDADMMACKTVADLAKIKEQYLAYAKANPSEKDDVEMTLAQFAQMGDEVLLERILKIAEVLAKREAAAAKK